VPRGPALEYAEVLDLARDSLRRRLEAAEAPERAAWCEMALHQRLGFALDWLYDWSKHFSMSRIAQRIGVSRQAISKIRKGEVVPTSKLLIPLARELGLSYRFLTDGTLDYPQPDRTQHFFQEIPLDLAQWALAEVPGRRDYIVAALEMARAAEHRNVDLRFLEQFLKVVQFR